MIMNDNEIKDYNLGINPRLIGANSKGELTWYAIGFESDFKLNKQQKITIRDKNYIIWRDNYNFYALKDACSHQGSSFSFGEVNKNCIKCPYHGYTFNSYGKLTDIPNFNLIKTNNTNIEAFKVVKKNNIVYLNTVPMTSENCNEIDEKLIWEEPEASDPKQKVVYLSEAFEHNAKFVSINSLDICHIAFVHTFGNNKDPYPVYNTDIKKMNKSICHYFIKYRYISGENSIVNKIYNYKFIDIHSEYIIPHTTVARVIFGSSSSTIITHALPISKFKTKLFVKAYRTYWSHNNSIINSIGNYITKFLMFITLKQDKLIIDNINKLNNNDMHGYFSIKYDMMANHYKFHLHKYFNNSHII